MVFFIKVQALTFLISFIISDIMCAENQTFPCEIWKSIDLGIIDATNDDFILVNGTNYPKKLTFQYNGRLRGCVCSVKDCLRKCCPQGQAISRSGVCIQNNNQFTTESIQYYEVQGSNIKEIPVDEGHFHIINTIDKMLYCSSPFMLEQINNTYFVLANGSLTYRTKENLPYKPVTIDKYCLEYSELKQKAVPVLCLELPSSKEALTTSSSQPTVTISIILPLFITTYLLYSMFEEFNKFTENDLLHQLSGLLIQFAILSILMLKGLNISSSPTTIVGNFFQCFQWILANN